MATQPVSLSPGEWAVLGVVAEGPTHGFAVAQLLAEDGSLGRVWTVPRPLVYQALNKLLDQGLIAQQATERSHVGPSRRIVTVTTGGRRVLRRWLATPVEHVRDIRSLLLLRLALLDRAGTDPRPLLEAQRTRLEPQRAALEQQLDRNDGFERVLAQWRLASSHATLEFIEAILSTR
ncbi:MAG: PadR family transcriptional regulator [Nocardioidaceae bacterium]